MVAHQTEAVFPKGKIFPGGRYTLEQEHESHLVRFINAPGVRYRSLAAGYLSKARRAIRRHGMPQALLTYNPYPWNCRAVRMLRDDTGLPWVCLNLDFDDPGDNFEAFMKQAGDADAHVFLSWWAYEHAPVKRKLYLDSGVSRHFEPAVEWYAKAPPRMAAYTGKIGPDGGSGLLADMLARLPASYHAVVCGKGNPAAEAEIQRKAPAADFRGFVSDAELHQLSLDADVFINPRPSDRAVNKMIFPSKLLEYLAYGKPVVSTMTPGIGPEYRDILIVPEREEPEAFARAIEEVLNWSAEQRKAHAAKTFDFLRKHKTWLAQAKRFTEFCEALQG